jgi:hypothetical protein
MGSINLDLHGYKCREATWNGATSHSHRDVGEGLLFREYLGHRVRAFSVLRATLESEWR